MIYSYEKQTGSLPEVVRKWAGLSTPSGDFKNTDLAQINDDGGRGSSFKSIAKLIESEPEGLFQIVSGGKMTPQEVRAKWVAALRSGEYKQGRGSLHNSTGYCCLGVLCDLAVKSGIATEYGGRFEMGDRGDSNYLPEGIRQWAGLCTRYGNYGKYPEGGIDKSGVDSLAQLNDSLGFNFNQIAEVIESNPPGLFCNSESTPTESTSSDGA